MLTDKVGKRYNSCTKCWNTSTKGILSET